MKKILFCLMIMLCVALTVLPTGAEATHDAAVQDGGVVKTVEEKAAWQTFVEEKVVPGAIFSISAVGAVYVAISPILAKMRNASEKYSTAAEGVELVSGSAKVSVEEVKRLREEIADLKKELLGKETSDHELLLAGVRMMGMAFSHEEELVRNGAARKIMEMLEASEKNE